MICILAATTANSYLIVSTFLTYFEFNVSTSRRTVFETPALFPKVTYCNKNLFTTEYAYNMLKNSSYDKLVYDMNYVLNVTERYKLRHGLRDILFNCTFNRETCTSYDFLRFYDPNRGNFLNRAL